jgi:hypothetical protein
MDGQQNFLDLWESKFFLGQEFLTWLRVASEVADYITLKGETEVRVLFKGTIKLEEGKDQTKQSLTYQPPSSPSADHKWTETFVGIMQNKLVMAAKLYIATDEHAWHLTLPADTLAPKSVKIVTQVDSDEEDGKLSQIGTLLDRVSLIAELNDIIEKLLALFIERRLSSQWGTEELPRIRKIVKSWIQKENI